VADIGKPKMALEQRRTHFLTPLANMITKKQKKTQQAFFKPEIEERLRQIAASTKNIQNNKAYFRNLLLYGPPGTGKTMVAKKIAEDSDMDFISMSSGNLTQFIKRKEHVSEFNRLFDAAEKGYKPTLVFIDEAEGMAKHRDLLDQEHVELLDAYLARTGTPSKQVMVVLATNLKSHLDAAVLSRVSDQIEIDNPELEQRIAIITQKAKELFSPSTYQKFFSSKSIQEMAKKTNGLSGRDLFYLVNALSSLEGTLPNRALTEHHVNTTINQFMAQKVSKQA
jgi:ATPase family AAA domain-containing protein 3A/B